MTRHQWKIEVLTLILEHTHADDGDDVPGVER
jgi:hypothetical protein